MTDRQYQVRLFRAGSTSLSTANVDVMFGVSALQAAPTVTGARARLLEGRVEASPFSVTIVDTTGAGLTGHLADAGGRLTAINRFAQVLRADAGGSYSPIGGGRITDVTYSDNLAEAQLTIGQEWPTGAASLLFTTNTTHLYPPCADPGGTRVGFFGNPYRYGYATLTRCVASSSVSQVRHAQRFWQVAFRPDNPPMNQHGWDAIAQDQQQFLSTVGAFHYLRFRVGGVDYPVASFGTQRLGAGILAPVDWPTQTILATDQQIQDHIANGVALNFWIAASSTAFGGTGSKNAIYEADNPFLHMMSAPPSEQTPLHLWQATTSIPSGFHPMQLLKNILDGAYSHSTVAYQLPLYSTSAFTGTNDLRKIPLARVGYRITAPQPMQDWVESHLCAPFRILPTQDVTGAIRFRSFRSPSASTSFSTSGLYGFTSTNLRAPHPDWRANRAEACTVLTLQLTGYGLSATNAGVIPDADGADNIRQWSRSTALYHDRVQQIGQYPVTLDYTGRPVGSVAKYPNNVNLAPLQDVLTFVGQEVFSRFGDGPVQGTLHALEGASTVRPGDWVTVQLPTYPNLKTNTRGGTRIVQMLSRTVLPDGYDFDYLDLGPAQTPTTAPTFALAVSTQHGRNALKATIGGIPTSGHYALYVAPSSGTVPATASTLWHPVATRIGNATVEINKLPSGTWFWGRVQGQAPGRAWSAYTNSSARVQTTVLNAPTGLKTSNIVVSAALSTWVSGEPNYPVQLFVDNSTAASASTANAYGRFPAGTQQVPLTGLDHNHKHKVMVRHYDDYGGVSAVASSAFTTLSTGTRPNVILPPPPGMTLIGGSTV